MSKPFKVTVVIPTKNGDFWIKDLILGIRSQTIAKSTEIIVLDSNSQDDTLEILSELNIKVIKINPDEFNH